MTVVLMTLIMLSGPGPDTGPATEGLPSAHSREHQEHRGSLTLTVEGSDGGRSLNSTVYGFLPYWGSDTWLRYDLISVLACFCVDMGGSGAVTAYNGFPAIFQTAIDSTSAAGGISIVTVVNFSSSGIDSILTVNRSAAIQSITELVQDHPVSGVSIDFENVSSGNRDDLTSFMQELRSELDTQVPGSHLSICTPAVDWSDAFDYSALAECCDALFIMCYPFHGTWSSVAGPCCPLTGWGSSPESSSNMVWCLGDYARHLPEHHDRIVVGLPYYGHEWETAGSGSHSGVTGSCSTLFYTTLSDRAAAYGRLWDGESGTPWYVYSSGGWRQGWYDDEESLALKYQMILQAELQGAGIWALGYDGSRPELWDCLEEAFTGPLPADSITDNLEDGFTAGGPLQYWRNVTQGGLRHSLFYTYSISSGPDVNWAEWNFDIPDSSCWYMLEVYVPQGGEAAVDYVIFHGGASDTVTLDQSLFSDQWVPLGGPWNASEGLTLRVGDWTGVSGEKIMADAARFSIPAGTSPQQGEAPVPWVSLISRHPASSYAIRLNADSGPLEFRVFDSSGRCRYETGISSGERILTWPVTRVPRGLYFGIATGDGCTETVKLLVI